MKKTLFFLLLIFVLFSSRGQRFFELHDREERFVSRDMGDNNLIDSDTLDCNDPFVKEDDNYKYTELGLACASGDLDKAKELISHGSCLTRCLADNYYEYSAIYTAVLFEQVEMVRFLVKNEDVNQIYTEDGLTLLILACKGSDLRKACTIAEILVDTGADVNGAGDCGSDYILYPLFEAMQQNNVDLVKFLILRGANIAARDKQGNTIHTMIAEDNRIGKEMKAYINGLSDKNNGSIWNDMIRHLNLPAFINVKDIPLKITFRNTESDYCGDERYNFDRFLIEITESDYNSALKNYTSLDVDSLKPIEPVNGTFTVGLQNGGEKRMKNIDLETGGDQMIDLEYIGYLPSFNCYAFSFRGLISDGVIWVSKINGDVYPLRGFPFFTLDKSLFAIVRLDGDAGDFGTIAIYGIVDGEYKFLFGLWSDMLLPVSACWDTNNSLFIKVDAYDSEQQNSKYYKLSLDDL